MAKNSDKEPSGKSFYINSDRFEKIREKAFKLSIIKQDIVKTSSIINKLIDVYLDDCYRRYEHEIREQQKNP